MMAMALYSPALAEDEAEAAEHATELAAELVLVLVGLLLIAAIASSQTRRLRLPFTTLLVVLGMGLSALSHQPGSNTSLGCSSRLGLSSSFSYRGFSSRPPSTSTRAS